MPASRRPAATMRLPRSWPSKPIFVISTFGRMSISRPFRAGIAAAARAPRDGSWGVAARPIPGLRPVQGAQQHQPQRAAVHTARQRQVLHQLRTQRLVFVAQRDQAPVRGRHVARPHADHDLRVVVVLEDRLEVRDARRFEPLPRIGPALDCGAHPRGDAPHAFGVYRGEEVFLRREVVVQRPRQHVDRAHDVAHRRALEALRAERPRGLVEDLRQAVAGARKPMW